jgi:hypothetical protein
MFISGILVFIPRYVLRETVSSNFNIKRTLNEHDDSVKNFEGTIGERITSESWRISHVVSQAGRNENKAWRRKWRLGAFRGKRMWFRKEEFANTSLGIDFGKAGLIQAKREQLEGSTAGDPDSANRRPVQH